MGLLFCQIPSQLFWYLSGEEFHNILPDYFLKQSRYLGFPTMQSWIHVHCSYRQKHFSHRNRISKNNMLIHSTDSEILCFTWDNFAFLLKQIQKTELLYPWPLCNTLSMCIVYIQHVIQYIKFRMYIVSIFIYKLYIPFSA